MSSRFLFRTNWDLLWREVWIPLSKKPEAPNDLFVELYRFAVKESGFDLKVEVVNDYRLAKKEFKRFRCPPDEKACVKLLEGFVAVLAEFNETVPQDYVSLLGSFIERYNLRYIMTPASKVKMSLPGLLISQYTTLKKNLSQNHGLSDCLRELENNIGNLSDDDIERNCIRVASNLLEGVVVYKSSNGENTLGKAIDGCATSGGQSLFPHKAMVESVKKFYKFFNDYPNLRHPGTTAEKLRELKKDDSVLSIWFAVIFASYLANNDAFELISMGEL